MTHYNRANGSARAHESSADNRRDRDTGNGSNRRGDRSVPQNGQSPTVRPNRLDRYSLVSSYVEKPMPEECTICMTEYRKNEQIRRLGCFHFFHVHCIDNWLTGNRVCPVCRFDAFKRG